MAFTEFCCRSGGSNLNAGTRTGNSTEPGTSADFTYATGSWASSTRIFTAAATIDGSIAAGDFVSIYDGSPALTGYVARITGVTGTTITTDATAFSGTKPGDIVGTATAKIGGAWKGPNAAEAFPFNFIAGAMTNAAADRVRVNLKNDATYSITAATTHSIAGPTAFSGYTTSYGDGGKATVDGGTTGASYTLSTISANGIVVYDLVFQNNGATGNAAGVTTSGGVATAYFRVVVNNVRGSGLTPTAANLLVECETYQCNQSNGSTLAGMVVVGGGSLDHCTSHDNNGAGIRITGNGVTLKTCIAETNTLAGVEATFSNGFLDISDLDTYNNGTDGLLLSAAAGTIVNVLVENSNFIKNGGYGINRSSTCPMFGFVYNCGFGSGTQANTSGTTHTLDSVQVVGSVTYAADITPWVDPANGDFRINLGAAKGAGRGAFTETAASYSGTIGYPDIGAAQHLETVPPVGHQSM